VSILSKLARAHHEQVILPDLPAGGFKASGVGREYGADAVLDWTEIKTVLIKVCFFLQSLQRSITEQNNL
jgi:hypothetical protein